MEVGPAAITNDAPQARAATPVLLLLWKILKEMRMPGHPTCLLRNLYAGQEAQLQLDMEKQTGSTLGKEYIKVVY